MNLRKLQEVLHRHNQPPFRLGQIQKAVFRDGVSSWGEITTLSKDLRSILEKETRILSFAAEKVCVADDRQSRKVLLRLGDGQLIETVLIAPKPGVWSACISCQVGCPMNCRFCATGKLGLQRNLTAEEITDQILFWKQYLKNNSKFKIQNSKFTIVYMGMGEPFANWVQVRESLKNLTDPELFGFGSRSISVSTSGLPDGIQKLAAEFPQVNLAVSLHFADDRKRSAFMPVNKKFNLEELRRSLRSYLRSTNRKVFIEYILLEGINDTKADAKQLADYLKSIGTPPLQQRCGGESVKFRNRWCGGKLQLLHVNLIRYNTTGEKLKPSSRNSAQAFKNYLSQNHIQATIRKSLGEEIKGACGQLAGK